MMHRTRTAALALWGLGCLLAADVQATAGEHEWSVAAGAGRATSGDGAWLAAADLQGLFHASDFWAFGGTVRGRAGGAWGGGATLDARWTVDALQWIPSLSAGAGGGWWRGSPAVEARLEASVAYRRARDHGWVGRVAMEQVWPARSDASETRWLLTLGWVAYRGRGLGLDL